MPYKDLEKRKEMHKIYSKKHYEKGKTEGDVKLKKSNQDKKKAWKDYKATLSCSLCGFKHPAAMDFHHVDPKTKVKGVHDWARMGSYKKAHEEVTRCIVLCANCHRILHYDLQNEKQTKQRKKKGAVAP